MDRGEKNVEEMMRVALEMEMEAYMRPSSG
jgi:hypothetical protein